MGFDFESIEVPKSAAEELNDVLSAVFSGDWFIKEGKLTPDMPYNFLREKVIRKIFGVEPNQEWENPVKNSSTEYALLTDSRYIIYVTMIGNGFGDEFQDLSDDHTGWLFNAPVVVFTLNPSEKPSEKNTFTRNINDENNTYEFQGVGRFKTIENGKVILEKLWDVCYLPKHQI